MPQRGGPHEGICHPPISSCKRKVKSLQIVKMRRSCVNWHFFTKSLAALLYWTSSCGVGGALSLTCALQWERSILSWVCGRGKRGREAWAIPCCRIWHSRSMPPWYPKQSLQKNSACLEPPSNADLPILRRKNASSSFSVTNLLFLWKAHPHTCKWNSSRSNTVRHWRQNAILWMLLSLESKL